MEKYLPFTEDFQIIVSTKNYLGKSVSKAFVCIEPWKLLEGLSNRLSRRINIVPSTISKHLMEEGPILATDKPIENIPKGQKSVIDKALNEPVCVVWGPPGTGKTHTMSELAINFLKQNKKILIVSHSNVSVDGVIKKIYVLLKERTEESLYQNGRVLRYGYVRDEEIANNKYINSFMFALSEDKQNSKKLKDLQSEYSVIRKTKGIQSERLIEIRNEIKKIRMHIKEKEENCVRNASVVATTISKVVIDKIFDENMYDVVMFDEISMANVLQVLCAATYAKEHIVCVGDFMQLAPIVQSERAKDLKEDIFTYLGINRAGKPYYHPWLVMLDEQRRMHPDIANFSNKYIYKGMLKNHESVLVSRNDIIEKTPFRNNPVNILDLTGSYCAATKNVDNSRFNIMSATISFATAIKTNENINSVSIITPYAAQTRLVRALILDYRDGDAERTNVRCATVHQFQGTESDVIIFDSVESYPHLKPGWLMSKDSNAIKRLINVAVTRAKGKLITISNVRFWEKIYSKSDHTLYKLLDYSKDKGKCYSHFDDSGKLEMVIDNLSLKKMIDFYTEYTDCFESFIKEVEGARSNIIVSLPSGKLEESHANKMHAVLKNAIKKGIRVSIKTNGYSDLPNEWKTIAESTEDAVFPLVIIDDRITWYGMPLAKWNFKDKNTVYNSVVKIAFRIKGERTAELIKSLASLEYTKVNGTKEIMVPKENNTKKSVGFANYVKDTEECSKCKAPLSLAKGKSGKSYMKCTKCGNTELITKELLNNYIGLKGVTCPQHNCRVYAGLSKYGIYVKCSAGHYLKPDEI
jgi:hypothetical protein